MADWISKREQDLVDLCLQWAAILADPAKIAAYGWDAAECARVLGLINAFLAARTAHEADKSPVKRLVKDEAKGEAIDGMRDFANSAVRYNKKMDDAAKLALGIHPRDTTPTAHGTPVSRPGTEVENTGSHFEHRVWATNTERMDHSKPADAYGVRYAWQIGGERPTSGGDIKGKTKFSRKTALLVQHDEADKGKTAYYSSCYENSKGDAGPWSPVVEAVIG
jgi:hypothetical protein